MLKQIIILLILQICFYSAIAQSPNWLKTSQRKFSYPDSLFLTGFSNGTNSNNEPTNDFLNKLSGFAKKELIESIQVSIQSTTTQQLEETKNKVNESFNQSNISLSKAEIVGLKIETFYDKKNKTGYAFAFASKQEVINYYKNIIALKKSGIENKFNEAKLYISTNNNQNALKILAQSLSYFREIENAKYLLIALGITNENYLLSNEIGKLYLQIKESINKIYENEQIILRPQKREIQVKINQPIPEPIEITGILKLNSGVEKIITNLPILFNGKTEQYCKTSTDNLGNAKCFINKISSTEKIQIISCTIDLSAYLGIDSLDTQNEILKLFSANTDIKLNASGLTFWINSEEYDINSKKLSIPFIEPKIKESLSAISFTFVDNPNNADFKIQLIAKTRTGNTVDNMYFSYLDATVSVFDLSMNKEIYKNSFSDIKGGGNSFEKACINSFKKASEKISIELTNILKK